MARFYLKLSLYALLVLFCILFGVSLATKGIERVQGPIPPITASLPIKDKSKPASLPVPIKADLKAPEKKTNEAKPTKVEPSVQTDTSTNWVGNKLGKLLQITAHHTIQLFVGLFDMVLGLRS
ncbi:hypothetical protein D3C73_1152540 [compost metagenome]